jgi:hypothetical protein
MNSVDLLKKSCNFALGAVHDDLMDRICEGNGNQQN